MPERLPGSGGLFTSWLQTLMAPKALLELPLRPKNEFSLHGEASFICVSDSCDRKNFRMVVKIAKYVSHSDSEHLRYLLDILPFSDIFVPNLHPWTAQAFQHFCGIQTHQVPSFVSH